LRDEAAVRWPPKDGQAAPISARCAELEAPPATGIPRLSACVRRNEQQMCFHDDA
jgi:hypothetical protein